MDSLLSLDELHVSFPRRGSNLRKRNEDGEDFYNLMMKDGGEHGHSHYRAVDRERSKSEAFLSTDCLLADRGRETEDPRRLPSIRPVSGKQKNGLRKGRNQAEKEEFSCIDVEHSSTLGKRPTMVNTRRDMKEKTKLRNDLKYPGIHNCFCGEKVHNDPMNELCSLENCRGRVFDTRSRLSIGDHYSDVLRQSRELPVCTPPVSPKPELPLEEKISKFLEMEFAIIKGENVNTTPRRRRRPLPESARSRERGTFHANPVESRKSQETSMPELGKPVRKLNIEENQGDESTRRHRLRSPRPRNSNDVEKCKHDSVAGSCVVNKKQYSDSQNSPKLPLKLDLNGTQSTQSFLSEQKGFLATSTRDTSPRLSPKEFGSSDRPLFGLSSKSQKVQELPLDLPEKVTKFIEMEFSIIKGENASLSQKQKYSVSSDSVSPREKAPFFPNPMDRRKSDQPLSLLKRRGGMNKSSSLNMK